MVSEEYDRRAEELRNRYGFEGFDQLDGWHPAVQWELAVQAAQRLQALGEKGKIQVYPMGNGAATAWDGFEDYILQPEGEKPVVEVNYVRCPARSYLVVGCEEDSPTGEYRPIDKLMSPKELRVREEAPIILLTDDWTTTGRSLIGGPAWAAENRKVLGCKFIYTFVFRDFLNLTNIAVTTRENPRIDCGRSIARYLLKYWHQKYGVMRKTFKYFKDNEILRFIDPWGWEHLQDLEKEYTIEKAYPEPIQEKFRERLEG